MSLNNEQIKQIEALTREAAGFSEKRGDLLNAANLPFNSSGKSSGTSPFWQQQMFIDQLLATGRWLLILLMVWLLWRKAARPQLARRAKAVKTVQQQAQAREEVEDAMETCPSKDEQLQQWRVN